MAYNGFKKKITRLMNDRAYAGKRYLDLFMMALVVLSVIILIVEMEYGHEDIWGNLYVWDEVFLSIFILEYILRFWVCSSVGTDFRRAYSAKAQAWPLRAMSGIYSVAKGKIKFMIQPMSIVDLLAILPMLRVFRAIRIFRLLRLFKLVRYSQSMESLFSVFEENAFEMGIILAFISLFVIVSSSFIYVLEKGAVSGDFESLGDAVWWSFVTITTVGYGDKVPITSMGRVVGVFLMLGGIVTIALPSGIIASAMTQKFISIREGRLSMRKFKNHVVICGWNNSAEQLMKEFEKTQKREQWDVVAVTLKPPNEIDSNRVILKQGDFTKETVLNDVNVKDAHYVIVVAEELRGISDESIDARSFLACNLIHHINPDIYIIAQLLNTENAGILKKTVKNVEVIISDDITGGLLSSSLITPGTSKLVNTMISSTSENIVKISLDKLDAKFNTFRELLNFCRKPPDNWLPLAIERDGEIIINPKDDMEIMDGDQMFCIQTEMEVWE
jgi:voltage-gated potassium channel